MEIIINTDDKIIIDHNIISSDILLKYNIFPIFQVKFHTICNKIEYLNEYLYAT